MDDFYGIKFSVGHRKGKKLPKLLLSFAGEQDYYEVATFKDEETANWFLEVVSESFTLFMNETERMKRDLKDLRDGRLKYTYVEFAPGGGPIGPREEEEEADADR